METLVAYSVDQVKRHLARAFLGMAYLERVVASIEDPLLARAAPYCLARDITALNGPQQDLADCLRDILTNHRPSDRIIQLEGQRDQRNQAHEDVAWPVVPDEPREVTGELPPRPTERQAPITKAVPFAGGIRIRRFVPQNWRRFRRFKSQGKVTIVPNAYFDEAHEWDKAKAQLDYLLREMAWGETEGRQYYLIETDVAGAAAAVAALKKRRQRDQVARWVAGGGLDLVTGEDTGQRLVIYSTNRGILRQYTSQALIPDRARLFELCMDLIRVPTGTHLAPCRTGRADHYLWGYRLPEKARPRAKTAEGLIEPKPHWTVISEATHGRLAALCQSAGFEVRHNKTGSAADIALELEPYLRIHIANNIGYTVLSKDPEILELKSRLESEMSLISPIGQGFKKTIGEMRDIGSEEGCQEKSWLALFGPDDVGLGTRS